MMLNLNFYGRLNNIWITTFAHGYIPLSPNINHPDSLALLNYWFIYFLSFILGWFVFSFLFILPYFGLSLFHLLLVLCTLSLNLSGTPKFIEYNIFILKLIIIMTTMPIKNTVNLASFNCNGLCLAKKRLKIFQNLTK